MNKFRFCQPGVSATEDKVRASLISGEHASQNNYDTFFNDLSGQRNHLINRLTSIPPEDRGGLIAITGFFYQMLVAIEYIIEMIQGKWDFVALELHDDIVVGKGKLIRFIQVKSSEETHLPVTSKPFYTRSKVNMAGIEKRRNDSWIDKLLSKAKDFPACEGYTTQFEIATSYVVVDGLRGSMDVSRYRISDDTFPESIPSDDQLLYSLSKTVIDKNGNDFDYKQKCGESLQELLQRFRIVKRHDLVRFEDYMMKIQAQFGALLGERIALSRQDLLGIIGFLLEKCVIQNYKGSLYLTYEEALQLKQELFGKVVLGLGQQVRQHDSVQVLKEIFSGIRYKLENEDVFTELEPEIVMCHQLAHDWVVNHHGDVQQIINRLVGGSKLALVYDTLPLTERNARLDELFCVNLILNLIFEEPAQIVPEHFGLFVQLLKERYVSHLHLGGRETVENGYEKLRRYVENASIREQVALQGMRPLTIIYGHRGEMVEIRTVEVQKPKVEVSKITEGISIATPTVAFKLASGKPLLEKFAKIYEYQSLDEMRCDLQNMWGSYAEGWQ